MESGLVECRCGCGELVPTVDSKGRPRKGYAPGHHFRKKRGPMFEDWNRVRVVMDGEEKRRLLALARARGMTLSAAIREGTRLYLDGEAAPLCPRCEGVAGAAPVAELDDDSFGHWFAGFFDGEGSLMISSVRQSVTFRCQAHITLRDDDRAIIELIRERLGFGVVYYHDRTRRPGNDHSAVSWQVTAKADVLSLVQLLDRYPLRAKKARDFAIWREAVQVWALYRGNRWTPVTERPWQQLAAMKAELQAVRAYR